MRFLVAYLAGSNGGGPYTFLGMLTTLTELFCADDFDISNINVINFFSLKSYFMLFYVILCIKLLIQFIIYPMIA